MHLCKKQNESKLQMVARPAHSKGTCPWGLSWGVCIPGNWGGGTAHRPGNFRVNTSCPPTPPPHPRLVACTLSPETKRSG